MLLGPLVKVLLGCAPKPALDIPIALSFPVWEYKLEGSLLIEEVTPLVLFVLNFYIPDPKWLVTGCLWAIFVPVLALELLG